MLLILSTLWGRSQDIILEPRLRVSFHGVLLLSAMGGFRIGVVKDLKYRQVQLAFVRTGGKMQLVATITLRQNKKRKFIIRGAQDET